jgi:hypothetical protein
MLLALGGAGLYFGTYFPTSAGQPLDIVPTNMFSSQVDLPPARHQSPPSASPSPACPGRPARLRASTAITPAATEASSRRTPRAPSMLLSSPTSTYPRYVCTNPTQVLHLLQGSVIMNTHPALSTPPTCTPQDHQDSR